MSYHGDIDTDEEILEFIFFNYDVPREYRPRLEQILKERNEYALLLFQPCGETHHDSNRCPYCIQNLNGKT